MEGENLQDAPLSEITHIDIAIEPTEYTASVRLIVTPKSKVLLAASCWCVYACVRVRACVYV